MRRNANKDGPRILVADASARARAHLGFLLDGAGYRVGFAADASAATAALERSSWDLVLADLALPGLAGSAGLAGWRRDGTPVIALARTGVAEAAQAFGFDGHLGAPIVAANLVAELRRWTSRTVPVWDRAVFREIAALLGPVRAGEALDLFERHLRTGLALVRATPRDGERLARQAHDLVGMAGMLGFIDLSRASRRLMDHRPPEHPDRRIRDLEVAALRALGSLGRMPQPVLA